MKKIILSICACLLDNPILAQTTTTGNYLVDTRPYYIDRMIPNASGRPAYTDDNLSENYFLQSPYKYASHLPEFPVISIQ